jgi:hypothetical protein
MAKVKINSFNAGELSPYLYARDDIDKYGSGCLVMSNFMPLPYGGATRRPAVEHKFEPEYTPEDGETGPTVGEVRLIPFTFSVEETYLLVVGDGGMSVYQDETHKASLATPWSSAELKDVKYCQSADVMWFVHPDHPVQRLERTDDTSWSIADVEWDYPPLDDPNDDEIYFDFTFNETAWTQSTQYYVGDVRQYEGVVYRCVSDHLADTNTFNYWWLHGAWIASNNGVSAQMNAYDAKSGGSAASAFTADSVGEYYFISNNRNNTIGTQAGIPTDMTPGIQKRSNEFYSQSNYSPASYTSTAEDAINVSYSNWNVEIETSSSGTFMLERTTDGGSTWEDYVFLGSPTTGSARNFTASSDSEEGGNTWIRIATEWTTYNAAHYPRVTVENGEISGLVRVTAYNSESSVDVEIITDIQKELSTGILSGITGISSTRSKQWSRSAFSIESGYPSSVALFENRLCFAGTASYPNRVWLSQVDDYQNFQVTDLATGAMDLTLNSGEIDEIRWMVPQERLVIGTAGSEWSLGADDERKAISPTGFELKRKTTYGSNNVQALLVNSAVLFLMRQSRKVREWTPNYNLQDFVAPDLSILAEHITEGGVDQWAYQQQPDNVLWSIRGDGSLLGFTYERDQNVTGWHRHSNDEFSFESVAVLPRDNEEDEVWVSVNMDGTRHVGRLTDREWGDTLATEWAGPDLWVDYQAGGDAEHLAGKTVELIVDGVPQGTQVVDGSGNITGATGTRNIVGLPYTAILAPMFLVSDNQYGTTKGTKADNRRATVRFKDTYSAKVGQAMDSLEDVKWDADNSPLYSEDAPTWFDNSSDWLLTTYVVQEQQMPCTVLALLPNVEGR